MGVAPRVVANGMNKPLTFKPNPMQEIIVCKSRQQGMPSAGGRLRTFVYKGELFVYQPDLDNRDQWESYYTNHPINDAELLNRLDAAVAGLEFISPI